jgi:hypothetical protein
MRLIDADALADALFEQRKNYPQWVADTICNMPTIPYDMKWNPDCEDCLPEGINDCIECRKRTEGR